MSVMSVARHDTGPSAVLRALVSQVHPVFMLPPLAASAFGAVLARTFAEQFAAIHLFVVFCALYTAHVKDGYVDFHRREEDDDHPLTAFGCRLALALATLGFVAGTLVLALLVDGVAALLCLPGWLVGYFHAPQLDTHPVTATFGYPVGIGFALLGGHYVQSTALPPTVLAFAAVFVVILAGIKIVDDTTDHAYDRGIDKRTVAVVLGPRRARETAYGLMILGLTGVVAFAAAGVFPPASVGAVVAFGVVAAVARRAGDDDRLATMLLVRASYLFLAVLVTAVWFRPLS
jgi:4-hydroxybenzoate polyprenyltransferase